MPSEPLRLAGVIRESVVDGPGWRFVIFAQGCPHHCPGCHNPETHDPAAGYTSTCAALLTEIRKNPLLCGVTLSGGEPFAQAHAFAAIARDVRALGLDIFTYTGYTFEHLLAGADKKNGWLELLRASDTLVDGRFVLAERTLNMLFRGSANQRVIDVAASLRAGAAVESALG
ncbi:MAG: anaerobic ribonucleoside-triphosphate reductase activating protein [Oscillospiraceae bacterium]|jgi:anaerobic ribonucleoside-triphosphate reductase activating protein|nr:anaerobic ribonucleoside-triphosphate reductase activating protein [Oscillospiraceae bacterium]